MNQDESQSSQSNAPPVTEIIVDGMTCGNCARHVTEALQKVAGVRSAMASLDSGRASVRWEPGKAHNTAELIRVVEEAGYHAKANEPHDHPEQKLAGWQLTLWVALLGTIVLMMGEWVLQLGAAPWFRWASLVVAALVQVYAGAAFYRGAWNQLKNKSANMDSLVALGSTTAFLYSAWALFSGAGGHLYFMEAAAIISLVSTGHWIESRVSSRASSALLALLDLSPERARRRGASGIEMEVPVAELEIGDVVVLRPGDRVPTDGIVLEGDSSVDETMLTGESVPVDKRVENLLFGGTLNLNGRLLMRVTATGEDTALAHIIAAVQRAQSSRANIQRLGDRVSNVFVPIVVTIAVAAGLFWGVAPEMARSAHVWLAQFLWAAHPPLGPLAAAFIIPAAVLIVACPCAMGLATPAALMAAANAAAKRGILIRDGVALEKAGNITAVLFDKTGTLTSGKPKANLLWESSEYSPNSSSVARAGSYINPAEKNGGELTALASALARFSNHPVSQAVAKLSLSHPQREGEILSMNRNPQSANGFEFTNWREIRGNGVEATWVSAGQSDRTVRLGSLSWLKQQGVLLEGATPFLQKWSDEESSIVGVAVEKSLRGLLTVRDTLKPSSLEVVQRLHHLGLKVFMITGDNAKAAAHIAEALKIQPENVFADVRPEQKAELVKKLQQQGERVAFIGDGINDAPALEQADLGIAVSRASDIARAAADIILINSEIEAVPESLGLARATLRTIKQNLFWAFFYNAIGIPLAAFGFISPVFCAAAMGLSDLVVIGNALRLRRWRL